MPASTHLAAEAEQAAVRELVRSARARGDELTGTDGLLKSITKQVIESALEEEMTGTSATNARGRGPQRRELPQRHPDRDGAYRQHRRGPDRGAAGRGRQLQPGPPHCGGSRQAPDGVGHNQPPMALGRRDLTVVGVRCRWRQPCTARRPS